MPSAVIGIKKWDKAHSDKVAGMLAASLEGGDQVKAFPQALKIAGDISAKIYGEQDGAYWVKYYKGTVERDASGQLVDLGGSYADNMNDALTVFGLAPGSNNNVKATYTVFAKIVDSQYHDLFAKTPIPTYEQAATTQYLLQAKSLLDSQGSAADVQQYSSSQDVGNVVSRKNWNIEFATGSAALTSQGMQTVQEIKDQVAITGLMIVVNGHTDNTGSQPKNIELSRARAQSVEAALHNSAPADFPQERFRVDGFGDSRPVADNTTADGRAKNRRVEIILAE
jgi:outer membrane protein OmpA-like peptidoglycan-associated protein